MSQKRIRKAVTLKDLAELAGCSKNTVSLALRDSRRISAETRRRIKRLAGKHEYIPNFAARNLSTNRSGMIGVYTRALNDAVRTELINALIAELHTAEYRPVLGLGHGHSGPWHTSPWMKTFQALKVNALVVVVELMEKLPQWCRQIPIILVGCLPDESLKCDYLALDRKEAGRMGIEYMLGRGHRNILIASAEHGSFFEGCVETLNAARADLQSFDPGMLSDSDRMCELTEFVQKQEKIPGKARLTGVVFGDSGIAANFIYHANKKKIKVPSDIAVVAYDYFPWADMLKVPLTTIEQPIEELARRAVEITKNRLIRPDSPYTHVLLPHRLTVRKSG